MQLHIGKIGYVQNTFVCCL